MKYVVISYQFFSIFRDSFDFLFVSVHSNFGFLSVRRNHFKKLGIRFTFLNLYREFIK